MTASEALSPLSAGLAALANGRWLDAREPLETAVTLEPKGAALEALGNAYFWLDHPGTIDIRERAYRAYDDEGDPHAAARVATTLAFDHLTFRGAEPIAQGWLELAGRALDGHPPSAEHAHLAAWQADFAIAAGDLIVARDHADRAVELGHQLGVSDVELTGRAQQGYLLVAQGRIAEGMRLLESSASAAVAGEFSDQALAGYVCSYAVSAAYAILDLPRALQWCGHLDELCRKVGFQSLLQLGRVQHAAVLVEQGDWQHAETELVAAAEDLSIRRPGMATEAVLALAELRRRQGRNDEATELFAHAEGHPAALLGQAWMALDAGDGGTAATLAGRFVRQTAPEEASFRSVGLNVLARAWAQLGDLDAARGVLAELAASLDGLDAPPLNASTLVTEALLLLAEGRPAKARSAVEVAIKAYDRAGLPFSAAHARGVLARVLVAAGDEPAARREADAAAQAYGRLGADTFAEAARKLVASPAPASPLTPREIEVLGLVASGMSTAEIARHLVLSEHTIHRHVGNVLGKLEVSSRAAAVARATALGLF